MYAQGIGVEQNNVTALEYFRRGAAKDHAPSQNGLGYMYMHGYGVEKNFKKAVEYFKAVREWPRDRSNAPEKMSPSPCLPHPCLAPFGSDGLCG